MPSLDPNRTVIRLEQPGDRPSALEAERSAFQDGRSGAPADDIVEIIERVRDEEGRLRSWRWSRDTWWRTSSSAAAGSARRQ